MIVNYEDTLGELENAIANNELFLMYQPQIDVITESVIGVEALLRWNSFKFGLVSPNNFIPIAENSELIVSIGEWVLLNACKQHSEWVKNGYKPIRLSVNVSVQQFTQTDVVSLVKQVLETHKMEPKYLEIEITESFAILDSEPIVKQLLGLKNLGVRIAIDDFGTGYSALSQLDRIPADTLKIDQTFIRNVSSDSTKIIIESIISLSHNLGKDVVAEGVETESQFVSLKDMGCNIVQGYFFYPPVDADFLEMHLQPLSNTNSI